MKSNAPAIIILEENMNTVMETLQKNLISWANNAAARKNSKQQVLLLCQGKNGKVGWFFTDLVLSSYFPQCAVNKNISYLVHLDIG